MQAQSLLDEMDDIQDFDSDNPWLEINFRVFGLNSDGTGSLTEGSINRELDISSLTDPEMETSAPHNEERTNEEGSQGQNDQRARVGLHQLKVMMKSP